MRKESDSLGEVEVPEDKYYGAQTQRSLDNFKIGRDRLPLSFIKAYSLVKKACALANAELGCLESELAENICKSCDEIQSGEIGYEHFPLLVWQTGSGTQSNMNLNEVIANRSIERLGGEKGSKNPIHPNDHVNKSQSSNDSFPTAMHVAAYQQVSQSLLPALEGFKAALQEKVNAFSSIYKIGRTHLMDATPLKLGQEFSSYVNQIENAIQALHHALSFVAELAIGGTAVGTGINAPKGFGKQVCSHLKALTSYPFVAAKNPFQALASHDALLQLSSALKLLATVAMKMANDIRLLASGPRCGLGELKLPANEPGSSIMPGKVNPTQCEALSMLCCQVMGNDAALSFANSQGHFQLNVYKPLIIHNLLHSIELLAQGLDNFKDKCLLGLEANEEQIEKHLKHSLMLATILVPTLGYDTTSKLVLKAHRESLTLKQAALELKLLSEDEFDSLVDVKKMVL